MISPRPPQTLTAQFKRPYRNCPEPTFERTRLITSGQFSPERVLTFVLTELLEFSGEKVRLP